MCVHVLFQLQMTVLAVLTYIAFHASHALISCVDTFVNIHITQCIACFDPSIGCLDIRLKPLCPFMHIQIRYCSVVASSLSNSKS